MTIQLYRMRAEKHGDYPMHVQVFVSLKRWVPSPEGKGMLRKFHDNEYKQVQEITLGKIFDLDIGTTSPEEARAIATKAAELLLAHATIEEFEVVIPKQKRA